MILRDLTALLSGIVPVETGIFSGAAPDEYAVIVPLADELTQYADNMPHSETQSVRISLFVKSSWLNRKGQLLNLLLTNGYTITSMRYIGLDAGYHHYSIDTEKNYLL